MSRARVADQDILCLDAVAAAAIGRAGINSMTVVDATTDCVAFDYLDAHNGKGNGGRLHSRRRLRQWMTGVALDGFSLPTRFMIQMILI